MILQTLSTRFPTLLFTTLSDCMMAWQTEPPAAFRVVVDLSRISGNDPPRQHYGLKAQIRKLSMYKPDPPRVPVISSVILPPILQQ